MLVWFILMIILVIIDYVTKGILTTGVKHYIVLIILILIGYFLSEKANKIFNK